MALGLTRWGLPMVVTFQCTHGTLVQAIEMSENVSEIPEYRTGVLQT